MGAREAAPPGSGRRWALPATRRLAPALAALAALLLGACGDGGRGHGGRGVLVIAIDGLRADHLGVAGYDRPTTPAMDALAREGAYFAQTFAAAPDRIPAHAALMTGCEPMLAQRPPLPDGSHLSLQSEWFIPREVPRLARELLVAGYATAAFVDHPWIKPVYGFSSGFEEFYVQGGGDAEGAADFGYSGVSSRLAWWLREQADDRDWFAYVHVGDLDRLFQSSRRADPEWDSYFEPREELDSVPPVALAPRAFFAVSSDHWDGGHRTLGEYEARYDGALRRLDGLLKRTLTGLQEQGRLEETTIAIVGTYGMGFGEAGLILDRGTLADVDLHVPWILRPARSLDVARDLVTSAVASTIDVAPTLLELAGLAPPAGMHGVSQVPVLRPSSGAGAPGTEGPRSLACSWGGVSEGFAVHDARWSFERTLPGERGPNTMRQTWYGQRQLRDEPWREHLRDRSVDPDPGNLGPGADAPEVAERLRAAGEEWLRWVERARVAHHRAAWSEPVSDEELRELERRGLFEGGP